MGKRLRPSNPGRASGHGARNVIASGPAQFDLDIAPSPPAINSNPNLTRPELFVRRALPKPTAVFATYWKFAKRRQDIFFARLTDRVEPTTDPILRRYRFTNTYRASDRVSQYLIRNVLYDRDWSARDLVFRALLFKFFNKIETWEALEREFGSLSWTNYDFDRFDRALTRLMDAGEKIYSAAYIMPSGRTAFGHERKHSNHLRIIEAMIRDNVAAKLADQPSLGAAFELLCRFPCIGPFVGYQFAIDLNYSPLLNFSENDFVVAGPGALDGIGKCFSDLGDYRPADIIRYMTDTQEESLAAYASGFRTLWGRPLHLIDCQNLFCEVSKYARVAHPDVEGPSHRKRIKQIYRPSTRHLDRPWYPPKWSLNQRIAEELS